MPKLARRPRLRGSATVWMFAALLIATAIAVWIAPRLHWGSELEPAPFGYPRAPAVPCATADDSPAPDLPPYRVRTPNNYRATYAHPVLIVLSPAGFGPGLTERHTGLTRDATARGLLVVYIGARHLSRSLPATLSQLPAQLARDWCIDAQRITYAGHSDGGTLAQVIALQAPQLAPRAVFASAAGLRESDFAALRCPRSAEVLLMHGRADTHFPQYGDSAARGWARCLGCTAPPNLDGAGCQTWSGCSGGSLRLCLHEGGHLDWPAAAHSLLLDLAAPGPKGAPSNG